MKYANLTNRQRAYVDAVVEHAGDLGLDTTKTDFSRAELRQVSMRTKGKIWIPNWITHDQSRRAARGVFNVPEITEAAIANASTAPVVSDTDMDAVAEQRAEELISSV